MRSPSPRGFTLAEILTVLVVIAVLTAIAIPMWRAHLLRVNRAEARDALIALMAAQDKYFGRHARYATRLDAGSEGLGLAAATARGRYAITLATHADGLGYLATARATAGDGQDSDSRCVELSIDHVGQMRAMDAAGTDRSADCWH